MSVSGSTNTLLIQRHFGRTLKESSGGLELLSFTWSCEIIADKLLVRTKSSNSLCMKYYFVWVCTYFTRTTLCLKIK